MANRDRLHGHDTGLVALFARAPQLCAGALAGLGSALWLNVVGPFAGLVAAWSALILVNVLAVVVVAALAILVTTAGTLLAADWRADVASRQAWAEMTVAPVELRLPATSVAPSQIDPRYLTVTGREDLQHIFRAHRFTSPVPVVEAIAGPSRVTGMVVASGESIRASLAPDAASRISRKASTAAVAMAQSPYRRTASASLGQELLLAASCRGRPRVFRVEPTVGAARIAANEGSWHGWAPRDRYVQARGLLHGHIADVVVLNSDWRDRDACEQTAGPPTGDGTVKGDEPPSCRGPPTAAGHRSRPMETLPVERSAEDACEVPAPAAPQAADPIVRDNLARQIPICAAELDVIETYLDQVLRDLLASSTTGSGREKA